MAEPTRAQEPIPSRLLLLFVALSCLLLLACTGDPAPERAPPFPDREDIAATIAERADVIFNMDQVRAIVAATDDRIVFEQYYGADENDYWDVYSITKSVISTLVGIALDEGLIDSLDDTLAELLPGYADDMPPAVAGATLHQLLTMTAGFPAGQEAAGPAFTQAEDWVHEILRDTGVLTRGALPLLQRHFPPARGDPGGGHRQLRVGVCAVTTVRAPGHRHATGHAGHRDPDREPGCT